MRTSPILIAAVTALSFSCAALGQGVTAHVVQARADAFPEVVVEVTVSGANRRPVTGLAAAAFAVKEDGAAVAAVRASEETADLAVVLVADASASAAGALAALVAALPALDGLGAKGELGLVSFADRDTVRSELTKNRARVVTQAQALKAGGGRALHDGLHRGVMEVASAPGRPVLVLIASGPDRNAAGTAAQSAKTLREVVKLARERRVAVWTVGLDAADQATLAKVALATGGQHYALKSGAQLGKVFSRLLSDAPRQYKLSYSSPKPATDGTERGIAVATTAESVTVDATARYRAPLPPPPKLDPSAVAEHSGGTGIVQYKAFLRDGPWEHRRYCIYPREYGTGVEAQKAGALRELGPGNEWRVPVGIWRVTRWTKSRGEDWRLNDYRWILDVNPEKPALIDAW